jgi:hypothetical protein
MEQQCDPRSAMALSVLIKVWSSLSLPYATPCSFLSCSSFFCFHAFLAQLSSARQKQGALQRASELHGEGEAEPAFRRVLSCHRCAEMLGVASILRLHKAFQHKAHPFSCLSRWFNHMPGSLPTARTSHRNFVHGSGKQKACVQDAW